MSVKNIRATSIQFNLKRKAGLSRLSASSYPKGDPREMRKKEYTSRYGFLNEKTMSSGFKALIPDPLSRYKYQTNN